MANKFGSSLLCAPLVSKTVDEMVAEMATARSQGADVAELRIDHLAVFDQRIDLDRLIKNRPVPVIVTYRPKWEGGQYEGNDNKRFEALLCAMELGAEYVDIELKVAQEFLDFISGKRPEGTKLIVSSHNYEFTPSSEDLGSLVARIQAVGADIVKIATFAVDICDVARMFQVLVHCQVPIIGLCMGERGVISRILCPKFGGYLTFGSIGAGKESAPGQPTMSDLLDIYRIKQIGAETKVYGLIGKPVSHSKSPKLHNAIFKAVSLDAVYVPFLTDNLADFLNTYSSPDFAGFSILTGLGKHSKIVGASTLRHRCRSSAQVHWSPFLTPVIKVQLQLVRVTGICHRHLVEGLQHNKHPSPSRRTNTNRSPNKLTTQCTVVKYVVHKCERKLKKAALSCACAVVVFHKTSLMCGLQCTISWFVKLF